MDHLYSSTDGISFGESIRSQKFMLDPSMSHLNHGSFGTVPKDIFARQIEYLQEQESFPDKWFRTSYCEYMNQSRSVIGDLINGSPSNIVLVENASSAVNSLLRSFKWKNGQKIIRFHTAYDMVIFTIKWLCEVEGIDDVVVDLKFPIASASQIVDAFKAKIAEHSPNSIQVAVFSHISSMPSVIEPVTELVSICQQAGILTIVDGAHAPGAIKIDVEQIGCDFYLGNCHKWMFSPRGSAFLYVHPKHQSSLFPQPTVISSSGKMDFLGRFEYTGTRDYVPLVCIQHGYDFMNYLGGRERVFEYGHEILKVVIEKLSTLWGTFPLIQDFELMGLMGNVVLPCHDDGEVNFVEKELLSRKKTFIVTRKLDVKYLKEDFSLSSFPPFTGKELSSIYYVRLSFQVYNTLEEYLHFGSNLLDLLHEYRSVSEKRCNE